MSMRGEMDVLGQWERLRWQAGWDGGAREDRMMMMIEPRQSQKHLMYVERVQLAFKGASKSIYSTIYMR